MIRPGRLRLSIFFLLLLSSLLRAQVPPPISSGTTNILPAKLGNIGIDQKLNAQIPPDLTFRDESGRVVHLGDYFKNNRPIVLTLVYYKCPMLCTSVLNDLLRAMNIMPLNAGADYDVLTVSFSPTEKSDLATAKKQEYLRHYSRGAPDHAWHFLTGDPESIAKLTQAVGFRYTFDQASGQYIHASGIMVLTPGGRISRYFFGIDYEPNDLRLALLEAAHGSIGSLTDRVLLFCYHYDPATGKYGLLVSRLLKIFGGATVLGLGGLIGLLLRMERKQKAHVG